MRGGAAVQRAGPLTNAWPIASAPRSPRQAGPRLRTSSGGRPLSQAGLAAGLSGQKHPRHAETANRRQLAAHWRGCDPQQPEAATLQASGRRAVMAEAVRHIRICAPDGCRGPAWRLSGRHGHQQSKTSRGVRPGRGSNPQYAVALRATSPLPDWGPTGRRANATPALELAQ